MRQPPASRPTSPRSSASHDQPSHACPSPSRSTSSARLALRRCTTTKAYTKLSAEDVSVTNQRDKLIQLPKIKELDGKVRAITAKPSLAHGDGRRHSMVVGEEAGVEAVEVEGLTLEQTRELLVASEERARDAETRALAAEARAEAAEKRVQELLLVS